MTSEMELVTLRASLLFSLRDRSVCVTPTIALKRRILVISSLGCPQLGGSMFRRRVLLLEG